MAFEAQARWRFLRAPICCALVLLTLGPAKTSRADEVPREAAGASYARGVELAKQGLFEAALEQFNDAYAQSPHFAVLYNIGQAQLALGRPVEAIEALWNYLRDGADKVPLSRREQVQAQIGLLESRLAELSINSDRAGASIRVDGRAVGRTPLFQSIRLAAGTHSVTGSLPDGAVVTSTVTLAEADRRTLELVFVTATPGFAVPPAAAPMVSLAPPLVVSAPAIAPAQAESHHANRLRQAAYVTAGVGVLSAGAALGVYLWNRGRYSEWRNGNASLANDTPGMTDYRNQANANNALAASLTTANDAILGLSIAAGVLVAAGASLFIVSRAHGSRTGELSFGWGGGSAANVGWRCVW